MSRILLTGATGLVGGHALAALLSDDRVTQIVAPTRRPLAPHARLVNPIVNSADLPLDAHWWHVDGALCALGTTRAKAGSASAFRAIDHDYVLLIARQVRKAGATRFALTSAVGANARSRFHYTRIKGQVEDAVNALAFPSLTIARPGFLGGHRDENRPMERIMGGMLRIATPLLPMSARTSPASTVARLLVDAAIGGANGKYIISARDIAIAAVENRHP